MVTAYSAGLLIFHPLIYSIVLHDLIYAKEAIDMAWLWIIPAVIAFIAKIGRAHV
jgi:hypothetical protein